MYVQIGSDVSVEAEDLVAVLDPVACESSEAGRLFIAGAKAAGRLRSLVERPSAYVVTTQWVYGSSVSTSTVKRRIEDRALLGTDVNAR